MLETGTSDDCCFLQVSELKRLANTLAMAQSGLRKVQEQMEECKRYATFLDSVTPPEWFAAQTARFDAEYQVRPPAQPMSAHLTGRAVPYEWCSRLYAGTQDPACWMP